MNYTKIFAPATIANVSCGFDAIGLAVKSIGDEMTFTKTTKKGVNITQISGADLTYNIDKNAAGAVVKKMLQESEANFGINLTIHKGFAPGSGLGSSAASAAGAAYGTNKLLGNKYSKFELIKFAVFGEEVACGTPISDNVATAIFGGFVLVRKNKPYFIKLPTPKKLRVVAIYPQIEIKTKDAREVLPRKIELEKAVVNWSNFGGLISSLYTNNYELFSSSLEDVVVEPNRKVLIPYFDDVKNSAIKSGALGSGISGSGPTIFAFCKGKKNAKKVYDSMQKVYKNKSIEFKIFISKINTKGVKVLK